MTPELLMQIVLWSLAVIMVSLTVMVLQIIYVVGKHGRNVAKALDDELKDLIK